MGLLEFLFGEARKLIVGFSVGFVSVLVVSLDLISFLLEEEHSVPILLFIEVLSVV